MRPVITIEDPADPRIAAYRDIRERDLVGRDGQFIAEGTVVLQVLATATRHRALSLLLAEPRVEAIRPLIDRLDAPVYTASYAVLERIAGFQIHRGVLAHGQAATPLSADALLGSLSAGARVAVLFGIANHDNIGGIFRNAAAFGAEAVILDAGSCDPLYRKAIRVSVGATLIVPFARLDADPIELLRRHGFETLALSPGGAEPLRDVACPGRAAILLGTEGPGLPADILAHTRTIRIPMAAGFDSLNVATTSGIVLHHLCREDHTAG